MGRIKDKFLGLRLRKRSQKLEQPPKLSEIQRSLDNLPKTYKRQHKLAVRRQYRCKPLRGIHSSWSRQHLAESRGVMDKVEAELRLRREEQEVTAGFDV